MDSPVISFNPNRHSKEQFVSNLTGSSVVEIFALATVIPALILLRHLFCAIDIQDPNTTKISMKKNDDAIVGFKSLRAYMETMAIDFLSIVLPMLLFLTVLSEWTCVCAVWLMFLLFFSLAAKRYGASPYLEDKVDSLRKNISSYRVTIMIITCLCILAVDFKIFPRRYAKTEAYGTSLMDLGVGSFVLTNSLVSRQARGFSTLKLRDALQSTSPLIILGIARLVSTASVDYQVHVGEYGVQWNFFFTLAAVSILTSIINVPPKYSGILGSLILLGYWGMYLIGVQLGSYLFFGNSEQVLRSNKWARIRVWILSLLFWLLTMLLDRHVERVSRRMCNSAYVTFVLAQNLQVLAILMLSDYIPGHKISVLEQAFNRNLLGSFLLANVLTGLVNLFVDTLFASSVSALAILFIYAFILSLVVGFVDFCGIKFKFW